MDVAHEHLCSCDRGYENICKWIKSVGVFTQWNSGSRHSLKGSPMKNTARDDWFYSKASTVGIIKEYNYWTIL